VRHSLLAARRADPQAQAEQIKPTELGITLVFADGSPGTGGAFLANRMTALLSARWGHRLPPLGGVVP